MISNVIIERMRTEIEAVRSPRWDLYSRFFSTYLHGTARHTFPRYAALCTAEYTGCSVNRATIDRRTCKLKIWDWDGVQSRNERFYGKMCEHEKL